MNNQMLVPQAINGVQLPDIAGYEWINKLPNKKIYFALFQGWPKKDLPNGYNYYIVSFHLEAVDLVWLHRQQVSGPIIVLFDGQDYNIKIPGIHFFPFFYWHYQLQQMINWFGVKEKSISKYKFSAVCNRITQSKAWITTKLLETAKETSLIVLNSWFEEKNVHNWQTTGNAKLDYLTQIFRDRYFGTEIKIDDFVNEQHNFQNITGNPWQPLYQDCAIHFTNESFHYSKMIEGANEYIWPGPFITEKTLKCLLGGTAFVPVGQFETYATLKKLGLEFDYTFDTSWDQDPGNLSRAESIVNLIDDLNNYSPEQLVSMTKSSCEYNQNYIVGGKFNKSCQSINDNTVDQIFDLISPKCR